MSSLAIVIRVIITVPRTIKLHLIHTANYSLCSESTMSRCCSPRRHTVAPYCVALCITVLRCMTLHCIALCWFTLCSKSSVHCIVSCTELSDFVTGHILVLLALLLVTKLSDKFASCCSCLERKVKSHCIDV